MRRSFHSFGGGSKGMGGGILRSAVRAGGVTGAAAIQESFSCSTNNIKKRSKSCIENTSNTAFSISSSSSGNKSSGFTSPPRYRSVVEESDWEYVNEMDCKRGGKWNMYFDDFVFGTVPSVDEVQHAISAIQNCRVALNSNEEEPICGFTDSDWIEPPFYSSMTLRPCGIDSVVDALDLLKADPSVQKMVVSISSDEAIWNAVLNNEAVRQFRDLMSEDADKKSCSPDESNGAKDIARWVINQIQAKVNQLLEKIMVVFRDVFQSSDEMNEGKVSPYEGKLRTSFFLSLVVMLMVVVTRSHGA